jgi:hypothetical protein
MFFVIGFLLVSCLGTGSPVRFFLFSLFFLGGGWGGSSIYWRLWPVG